MMEDGRQQGRWTNAAGAESGMAAGIRGQKVPNDAGRRAPLVAPLPVWQTSQSCFAGSIGRRAGAPPRELDDKSIPGSR